MQVAVALEGGRALQEEGEWEEEEEGGMVVWEEAARKLQLSLVDQFCGCPANPEYDRACI